MDFKDFKEDLLQSLEKYQKQHSEYVQKLRDLEKEQTRMYAEKELFEENVQRLEGAIASLRELIQNCNEVEKLSSAKKSDKE